jgi:large-conductance mechanosensitive channel
MALIAFTIATLTVVASEASLAVLHYGSYLLWSVNFLLLIAGVLMSVPLAAYGTYLSWQETKANLT